jgi:uncharacterized protein (DUF302 family)
MTIEKWSQQMSTEDKKSRLPEVSFLPPLNMVLSFFDKEARQRMLMKKQEAEKQQKEEEQKEEEKTVEKLIEKLSEKEK